jgi:hypothetical protein
MDVNAVPGKRSVVNPIVAELLLSGDGFPGGVVIVGGSPGGIVALSKEPVGADYNVFAEAGGVEVAGVEACLGCLSMGDGRAEGRQEQAGYQA